MFDIGATPRHGIQIHQEIQSAPCLQHVRCCHQHCAGVPAMKETILKRLAVKGDQEGQPWRHLEVFQSLWRGVDPLFEKWTANKHKQTGLSSNPREKGINSQESAAVRFETSEVGSLGYTQDLWSVWCICPSRRPPNRRPSPLGPHSMCLRAFG